MVKLSVEQCMYCPQCKSPRNKKNGFRRGKQSYRCKDCGCRLGERSLAPYKGAGSHRNMLKILNQERIQTKLNNANASAFWSADLTLVQITALKMYLNGMG